MASISDLSLKHRLFLAAYPFRRVHPLPWAPARPIAEARVALVTTAGLHLPGDPPFDEARRGGDDSFRVIPLPSAGPPREGGTGPPREGGTGPPREGGTGAPLASLGLLRSHRSTAFDAAGIDADPNLALPLDRLRELAASGAIGESAPRHLSFMGSITAPGRLVRESAPRAAALLRQDAVDAALLIPV